MSHIARTSRFGLIALLAAASLVAANVADVNAATNERSNVSDVLVLMALGQRVCTDRGLAAVRDMASDGAHLWIVTQCGLDGGEGDAIVELSASTGALIRIITDVPDPTALLAVGSNVWVIDQVSDEVFKLSTATGATEQVFTSRHFLAPSRSRSMTRVSGC